MEYIPAERAFEQGQGSIGGTTVAFQETMPAKPEPVTDEKRLGKVAVMGRNMGLYWIDAGPTGRD